MGAVKADCLFGCAARAADRLLRVCAAVISSKERASAQLRSLSREARGIELLNFYHFDEVILNRGCTWT
jgi:hypothetical protein